MKRFALATLIIALAAASVPALAQQSRATARTDEQKRQDEEADKAYRNTMKATGGTKGPAAPADPWGTVRPADANKQTKR